MPKNLIEYDEEIAKQAYAMCCEKIPNHQWGEQYILKVIRACCQGDSYWFKHHGAFDNYLFLQGKGLITCQACEQLTLYELSNEEDENRMYCDDCFENTPLLTAFCPYCKQGGHLSYSEIPEDGKCIHCKSPNIWIEEA